MTAAPAAPRHEQPELDKLLAGIRGNIFRLTTTTRIEYTRDNPSRVTSSSRQRAQPIKATAYTEPLLTALRDSIRPSQGATDSGRGGGAHSLPYNDNASSLLATIEAEIAGMYRSALDIEPIGTSEQLLLEWLREFEIAYRAGDVVEAQLTHQLLRIRGWRFAIEDHFTPPRKQEFAHCPACGYTHYETFTHGEIIRQRCVSVTYYPGNTRRSPAAECGHCGARWVGVEELAALASAVDDILADDAHALDEPIIAPIPDDSVHATDTTEEPDTEGEPTS